jgi:hypothetical protein
MSRAATKPPMPNMAAWPKLTCPTKPPIQFHASVPAIIRNARVRRLWV